MNDYLPEGMEYNADGDVVDSRDQIIRRLRIQLSDVQGKELFTERLRTNNPALQDAWDKYQTVLKLVEHA